MYAIARHHFPHALLAWKEESSKNRQWVKPLTKQQAKSFGCPTDKIDQHLDCHNGDTPPLYYQVPNVTKYDISQLLVSLTSNRGNRQQKRQRTDEGTKAKNSDTCDNLDDYITENLYSSLDDNSECMVMCEKYQESVNNENANDMNDTGEGAGDSVINDNGGCTVLGDNYKEFVTVVDINDTIDKGTCADDEITKNINFVISDNGGCVVVGGKCNEAANNENTSNMTEVNDADACADDDMTTILIICFYNRVPTIRLESEDERKERCTS